MVPQLSPLNLVMKKHEESVMKPMAQEQRESGTPARAGTGSLSQNSFSLAKATEIL